MICFFFAMLTNQLRRINCQMSMRKKMKLPRWIQAYDDPITTSAKKIERWWWRFGRQVDGNHMPRAAQ